MSLTNVYTKLKIYSNKRVTYLITILTIFSSFIGFVIQATLARKFGVGLDIDLYLSALSAPLFVAGVVTSAYAYGCLLYTSDAADE